MRITSPEALFALLSDKVNPLSNLESKWIGDLRAEAQRVRVALESSCGEAFHLKMEGQDRSDYAQLEIPQSMLNDAAVRWVEIRLSNTAPLAAVSDESKVIETALEKIKEALERLDYIVVDQSAFDFSKSQAPEYLVESETLWRSLFDYD